MNVREIMSQPVVTCRRESSLAAVARQMREADCGVLPVVSSDLTLVGIVTDRDICLELARHGSCRSPTASRSKRRCA
jgi:CBS domain-containing protein